MTLTHLAQHRPAFGKANANRLLIFLQHTALEFALAMLMCISAQLLLSDKMAWMLSDAVSAGRDA